MNNYMDFDMTDEKYAKILKDLIRDTKDNLDVLENELHKVGNTNINTSKCLECANCHSCINSPYCIFNDNEDRDFAEYDSEEYDEVENVDINIKITCDNKNLEEALQGYISEVVDEALEEFFDDEDDSDDDEYNDAECSCQLEFELIYDKNNEKVIGVIVVNNCSHCGKTVMDIFTNGNKDAEEMAKCMGYRED